MHEDSYDPFRIQLELANTVQLKSHLNLEDIAVCPNTDAILTVSIEGDNPTYQWQYSEDGSMWHDIEGETSSTLTLSNIPSSQNGYKYRCAVDSDKTDLTYSSVAILTVKPSPTLDNKFGKWAYDNKLEGDNALPSATPRNDGITNLEKFAFGLDASKATSYDANANFKHSTDVNGNTTLQFPVSVDAEGVVNVKALKSVDLINWTEATATATGETSSDGKFKIYKATVPIGEEGKVFLKLKVEEK